MRLLFTLLTLVSLFSSLAHAEYGEQSIYNLSLEQLADKKVVATGLTKSDINYTPSSITLITKQQIEQTPARNMLDLIETYVPGAMYVRQNVHATNLKIRGIGERNYNILLLVNGRPINQKNLEGAIEELKSWNLTDVQRIEVVRGPGSATYGPGAISGVINIITQSHKDFQGFRVGGQYNESYRSKGADITWSDTDGQWGTYFHTSIVDTEGSKDAKEFQTLRNGAFGYKGTPALTGNDVNPITPYLSDFDSEPQIKFHGEISYEDWKLWVRYANSGQNLPGSKTVLDGELEDRLQIQNRYAIVALENTHRISKNWLLDTLVSYDSEDFAQVNNRYADYALTEGGNRVQAWSEDELFLRVSFSWENERSQWVTAFEYSKDKIGPRWNESSDEFRTGAGGFIYVNDDSIYLGDGTQGTISPDRITQFISGWSMYSLAVASELNHEFKNGIRSVFSLRVDNHELVDSLYSPRISIAKELVQGHFIRASWQRSSRVNTSVELYSEHLNGIESEPERSDSFELNYHGRLTPALEVSLTPFYTESDVIGWSGARSEQVGELSIKGIELELKGSYETLTFGLNHSYTDMTEWDFTAQQADGRKRQDISYSDYFYNQGFLRFEDSGNSIANWANNHSKMWLNWQLNSSLILHFNARVIWDYPFGQDIESMYANAYANVDVSMLSESNFTTYQNNLGLFDAWQDMIKDRDPYGTDIRFNVSMQWQINENWKLSGYAQNLINFTDNKRIKYGFTTTLPVMGWTEEPQAFSVRAEYIF